MRFRFIHFIYILDATILNIVIHKLLFIFAMITIKYIYELHF